MPVDTKNGSYTKCLRYKKQSIFWPWGFLYIVRDTCLLKHGADVQVMAYFNNLKAVLISVCNSGSSFTQN